MPKSIPRRLSANRQNAKKSTGPRTSEGKANSRLNAIKHGILAESVVIPGCEKLESTEKFNTLLAGLTDELNPLGMIEEMLVETVAVSYWRLRRALRVEAAEIAIRVENHESWNTDGPIGRASLPTIQKTHMILRYETTIERRLHRALSSLYLHQARRKAAAASIASPLSSQRPVTERHSDLSETVMSSHSPSSYPPQMESSPHLSSPRMRATMEPQSQSDHHIVDQSQKLPNEPNSL